MCKLFFFKSLDIENKDLKPHKRKVSIVRVTCSVQKENMPKIVKSIKT